MENEILEVREPSALDAAVADMQEFVTRNYLSALSDCDVVAVAEDIKNIDITQVSSIYKINKLVYRKDESLIDRLNTIYNAAFTCGAAVVMIINSNGQNVDYYVGVVNKKGDESQTQGEALIGSINGNFPGSELDLVSIEGVRSLADKIAAENKVVSAISAIPALRSEDKDDIVTYTQGMENMIDALTGKVYTAVIVADAVTPGELDNIEAGYEKLYTQLSPYAKSSHTYNSSESLSLATSEAHSLATSINESVSLTNSISNTNGWNTSKSRAISRGESRGSSLSIDLGGVSLGKNKSKFSSETDTDTTGITGSVTDGKSRAEMRGEGKTDTVSRSESNTETTQYGRALQIESENKSVVNMLEKIDEHLDRLKVCRMFGAFNCAAYIISTDPETNSIVSANYNAIMRGKASSMQCSYVNTWQEKDELAAIKDYLSKFTHPLFVRKNDIKGVLPLSAASIITGNELSVQAGLPKKSVRGVTVIESVPFGRNVIETKGGSIKVGNVFHMGKNEGVPVHLDVESLSMHTFITGSTGSGKSTTVYSLLDKIMNKPIADEPGEKIKFMVIEPAKGEYKDRFGNYPNGEVRVYGTNNLIMPLLRINPFSFPEGVHVLEHIDRLIEIFNVCWPMYAAMPAVLKDAIERAYMDAGWELINSTCSYKDDKGGCLFPNFVDVLNEINNVMETSQYSADSKSDYKGALCTRVKSLTNGLYGQVFTSNELSSDELFEKNVIVDLSRVGSSETKSLIMGILVLKLQEYRMTSEKGANRKLRHVTVLEEAHNLLKKTSSEQSMESANLTGKSVEMIANAIAEMRTYGEGFIIADQAPGLMDMSVIRNTNTKIILRLPDCSDRELVGKAAALNDEQIVELSRLKTFVAAIYQNNWLEPVLCEIDTNFKDVKPYETKRDIVEDGRRDIVDFVLMNAPDRKNLDKEYIDALVKNVFCINIPSDIKGILIDKIRNKAPMTDEIKREALYNLLNTEEAFSFARKHEKDIDMWCEKMKAALKPDITCYSDEVQTKIMAMLIRENVAKEKSEVAGELFRRFMSNV